MDPYKNLAIFAHFIPSRGAGRKTLLPETGVCNVTGTLPNAVGCCGGPAPADKDACCASDAEAKEEGHDGCGCDR
jgi:hypothetical protein